MSYRAFLFDSRYNGLLGGISNNKKELKYNEEILPRWYRVEFGAAEFQLTK